MTLQEDFQKVKDAAKRLDRDIENSQRYRTAFLKTSD
jgi:hypothetical protein